MPRPQRIHFSATSLGHFAVASVLISLLASGCVGTLVNLMHAAHGNLVPANFSGLKGKRVAVICVSNSEAFGPTSASIALARHVGHLVHANVDDVSIVDPQEIETWIDRNDWDYLNYQAVGAGVRADLVIAVDLDGFSLHQGKTLYKGRADVKMVVYDMLADGREVFAYTPNQIQYPANAGHHTTDMSEAAFRRKFLGVVARRIARQFYSYDVKEDFASDATVISTP